jgi:hypothetical protein
MGTAFGNEEKMAFELPELAMLHDVRCFHLTLNTGVIKILPYH